MLEIMEVLHETLLTSAHELQSGEADAGDRACSALNEAVNLIESDSGEIDAEGTHLASTRNNQRQIQSPALQALQDARVSRNNTMFHTLSTTHAWCATHYYSGGEALLRCLVVSLGALDEAGARKELLDFTMLEVGPRLLALAECSEEAARLASVYFHMLSTSCSGRELVTVVLELFDVHSRDCYSSSMHLLLLQVLSSLPRLLSAFTRRRLQCALDAFIPVVELAEASGEHMGPIIEEHGHIVRGRGSVDLPDAAATRDRDVAMAGTASTSTANEMGSSEVVGLLQVFTEPFLQYAEDLHSQCVAPELALAISKEEDVFPAMHHFAAFLLCITSSLSLNWTAAILAQPFPIRFVQRVSLLLRESGVTSWEVLWALAGDEDHQVAAEHSPFAGSALVVLHSLVCEGAPFFDPPATPLDTLKMSSMLCAALLQEAGRFNSPIVLGKALQLLTLGAQLTKTKAESMAWDPAVQHHQLMHAWASAALSDPPTPSSLNSTSVNTTSLNTSSMPGDETVKEITGSCSATNLQSGTTYASASSPLGNGESNGVLSVARRMDTAGQVPLLRIPDLHRALSRSRPALLAEEEAMLPQLTAVLQVVAINVVHSGGDAARTAAFRCLSEVLSATDGALRGHCIEALCGTPSPDMSALMMQRVQQDVAKSSHQEGFPPSPLHSSSAFVLHLLLGQFCAAHPTTPRTSSGTATHDPTAPQSRTDNSAIHTAHRREAYARLSSGGLSPGPTGKSISSSAATLLSESELVERSDAVCAALNVLRFVLLRQAAHTTPHTPTSTTMIPNGITPSLDIHKDSAGVTSSDEALFCAALAAMNVLVVIPLQVMAERVAASLNHQLLGGNAQTGVRVELFDEARTQPTAPEGLVASFTGVSRVLEVLQRVRELYSSSTQST